MPQPPPFTQEFGDQASLMAIYLAPLALLAGALGAVVWGGPLLPSLASNGLIIASLAVSTFYALLVRWSLLDAGPCGGTGRVYGRGPPGPVGARVGGWGRC